MSRVTVWFPNEECPAKHNPTILWQQFMSKGNTFENVYSLPKMINDEAGRWKQTYLQWLNRMRQIVIGDKSLEQHLQIDTNLSYWWMVLPTEFSFSKDSLAYKCIRLWQLIELIDQNKWTEINIIDAESDIAVVLKKWGEKTGRKVHVENRGTALRFLKYPRSILSKNSVFQILLGTRHIITEFIKYGLKAPKFYENYSNSNSRITIIDYFDNFKVNSYSPDVYQSNYWWKMPKLLEASGIKPQWLHIDFRNRTSPSIAKARKTIDVLNKNSSDKQHFLLQDFMSCSVLICAISNYLKIISLNFRLKQAKLIWRDSHYGIDVWPMVKKSWKKSFYGMNAAENSIYASLFKAALNKSNKESSCLYLFENQPWELLLLNEWKSVSNKKIFGVPTSLVRSWDLRYALGNVAGINSSQLYLPSPDAILVTSESMLDIFRIYGHTSKKLILVEALRYLETSQELINQIIDISSVSKSVIKILVLGEYNPGLVVKQLKFINGLINIRGKKIQVNYRPHPSVNMDLISLNQGAKVSTHLNINTDLKECDLVFSSNMSSANIDAHIAGKPLIVLEDASVLDGWISGIIKDYSITSIEELIEAVDNFADNKFRNLPGNTALLLLDPKLPRWKLFLTDLLN